MKPQLNPYSWNDKAHLLFVDQPVGTGLSHSAVRDMSMTETAMANNILEFFTRFYELNPQFKNRKLFLSGESFAGNYLPHISKALVERAPAYIDFQGVAIGNGWTNPALQWAQHAKFGFAPENVKFTMMTQAMYDEIQPKLEMCQKVLPQTPSHARFQFGFFCNYWNSQVCSANKGINVYDIRKTCVTPMCYDLSKITDFMNSDVVRNELQMDRVWDPCGGEAGGVIARLEYSSNAAPSLIPALEKGLPVLIYSGEFDFACNWMGGDAWTKDLKWSGQTEFAKQEMVPESTYGFARIYKNFKFLKFSNAGHMVPLDQPEAALQMINKFMGFN